MICDVLLYNFLYNRGVDEQFEQTVDICTPLKTPNLKGWRHMKSPKLLSLLLALVMITALFAGCTDGNETPTPSATPVASSTPNSSGNDQEDPGAGITFPLAETMEYSLWMPLHESHLRVNLTLDEHPVYQELERRTNVHINFIHPTYGSEGEVFGIMMASQNYPDVFPTQNHTKGIMDLYNLGIIIDLTDLIPEHMPTYNSIINSDPDLLKDVKQDSGELISFNTINDMVPLPWRGLVVRQDLLDQLNLPIPETYDDWETVLTGFRDLGVKRPLFTANNGSTDQNFESGFGIGMCLYRDGLTVKYGPNEPQYRDYLETMSRWFAAGLIDPEFTGTPGFESFLGLPPMDVINRAEVGAGAAQSHTLGSSLFDIGVAEVEMYFSTAFPPVKNKGDKLNFSQVAGSGRAAAALAISEDCDPAKIPTLMNYFDYLYTEEGSILSNYGIQGESWEYGSDGNPKYTDIINSSGYDGESTFHVYNYAFLTMPFLSIDKERIQGRPQEILDLQSKWVVTGTDLGVLPTLTLTEDEMNSASSKLIDLNTYADEMSSKIIMGMEPLSAYDDFIDTIKGMGIDDVLTAYQAAYERYISR